MSFAVLGNCWVTISNDRLLHWHLKFHKNRLTECGPHWGCAQSRMIYGVVPGKTTVARCAPIAKPVSSPAL